MPEFDGEQIKLIHRAVRFYQMNGVVLDSLEYRKCDAVLNSLWGVVHELRSTEATCDI